MTHAKVFLMSAVAAMAVLSEAITKMLTDEGKNEPANAELTGTRLSITAFCQTVGKQDSTIKEAPHL